MPCLRRRSALGLLAALALLAGLPARAADGVTAEAAWARATAPGAPTGAVYVTLRNGGSTADSLTGATTEVADRVDMHSHEMAAGGVAHMHAEPAIDLPPGEAVVLAPGGRHLMLTGLHRRLAPGDRFAVTLTFAHAPPATVQVEVKGPGATAP
jgi:copper(I)-binding protein